MTGPRFDPFDPERNPLLRDPPDQIGPPAPSPWLPALAGLYYRAMLAIAAGAAAWLILAA